MSGEEAKPPGTNEDAAAPERQSTPFLVLQFFIFPMAIVAVCVTVFVIFGLVASDVRTPRQYLAEARAGGGLFNIKRWQAAYALASILESPKDLAAARKDPRFVEEVLDLYTSSSAGDSDDVLLHRYLTLALGRLGDPRALPELMRAAAAQQKGGDQQTTIYAIWALGSIGDRQAVPTLLELLTNEDRGIRKAVVHALGTLPSAETRSALEAALNDAADDVRWNAALALARQKDPAAKAVLLQMLDRGKVGKTEGVTPDQEEDALLQAIAVSSGISDAEIQEALRQLKGADPSLKVREAARLALAREEPR